MPDYLHSILAEQPTGYWKFDENRGDTVFDYSGGAHDLVINGAPTLKSAALCSDWPRGAMTFNVNNDCASGPNCAAFITNAAVTIVGIISPKTISQTGIILRMGTNDTDVCYEIDQNNDKLVYTWMHGLLTSLNSNAGALVAGQRNHFAVTRSADGLTVKFYVNGVAVGTVAPTVPTPSTTAAQILVGGNFTSSVFAGSIDELSVHVGVEMPAWKIANLYSEVTRVWPVSLQQIFDQDAFDETIPDRTIRFAPVYGPLITRPSMSDAFSIVNGSMEVDSTDRELIETFYASTLEGGSMTFEASLRGETIPMVYFFTKEPSFHDIPGSASNFTAMLSFAVFPDSTASGAGPSIT